MPLLLGRKGLHNFGLHNFRLGSMADVFLAAVLGFALAAVMMRGLGALLRPGSAARISGPVAGAQGMAQGIAALAPERSIRPTPRRVGAGG